MFVPAPSATSPTDPAPPVRVELHAEWRGGEASDVVDIDRAEWDAMTPAQRQERLLSDAQDWLSSNGASCGYSILGDDVGSDEVRG